MALKDQSYAGLCEEWVEDVTNSSIQGDTADDSWKNLSSKGKGVSGLNGIQPGDLVYFASDPNSSYGTDGHVGIYNGSGLFTSATDSGVATANINDWTKANQQQVLGYVPRKNLSPEQGSGGGSMAGIDPNAIVKIKSPQGGELQVRVSDLPAYGLSADNIPQSAYISGAPSGASTTPGQVTPSTTKPSTVQPGGGMLRSPSMPPTSGGIAGSGVTAPQLVGNAIAGENAGNVQKQNEAAASANAPTLSGQEVASNANNLQKQSLELQEEAFQKNTTLAPEVLKLDLAPKNGKPGMTLEHAMAKYGQFMKPADIFSMYNETNGTGAPGTWGPAKNSVAQLQGMGFNDIPKSVQDKQDSISAINLIRSLKSAWSQYISNPTDLTAKKNYEAIKNTLVDPSTNYGKLVAQYRNSFPDPNNPTTWLGADGGFKGVEQVVLDQSGGHSYKSLGFNDPYSQLQKKSSHSSQAGPQGNIVSDAEGLAKPVLNVANFLTGGAVNVAQDIGSGLQAPQAQKKLDVASQQASKLEQQAQTTKDPNQKKVLLHQANDIRQKISQGASGLAGSFSPDVTQNPIKRGVNAGIGIGTSLDLPAQLLRKGATMAAKDVGEKAVADASSSSSKGSRLFKTLKTVVTHPTKGGLYKDMQKTVKGAAPTYKNAADTAREFMGDAGVKQKQNLERWISHYEPKSDTHVIENQKGPPIEATPAKGLPKGITKEDRIAKFDKRTRVGETKLNKRGIPDYLTRMAKGGDKPLRDPTVSGPTQTLKTPNWTGSKALEARGELTRKLPTGLQKTFGRQRISPEDEQSIKALQHGISKEIKRVAPEMKNLDTVYKMYAHFGDPAKILGTVAAETVLDKLPLPEPVKQVLGPIVASPEGIQILRGI